MKFTKAPNILSSILLASMSSSFVFADTEATDSNWYMGGNIGQTRADIDEEGISNSLIDKGFSGARVKDHDNTDRGYKLYGGYQLNHYFALEGGYFDLGEFGFTSVTAPAGTFNGDIKLRGVNLDLVGFLPVTDKLSAFARAGVNYAETKDRFFGTGAAHALTPTASDHGANLKLGAGLQYAFTEKLAMRIEAERYRVNDAVGHKGDVDLISAGLVYRFGNTALPVPAAVYAPISVPAPAQVTIAPPAPRFEKYTLSATELFTFDSSDVNMPQAKLEEITTAVKGEGSPKQIVIIGYTDRLGSEAYNQKLSEQRAQAVKNYMVSRGVEANRLLTEGKGEADPIVTCEDKNKAKLIECLKPNRRVEIDQVKMVREIKSN